jgi:hypothetical protein
MCKLCGHAYGDHWREDNKCAVKDCQCPGYEKPDEEKAAGKKQLTTWHWSIALAALTSPLFFFVQFRRKIGNWTCGLAVSHDDLDCDEGPMGHQEVLVVLADDGLYCRRIRSSRVIGALDFSMGSRRQPTADCGRGYCSHFWMPPLGREMEESK